jgi:hypothetical protein
VVARENIFVFAGRSLFFDAIRRHDGVLLDDDQAG